MTGIELDFFQPDYTPRNRQLYQEGKLGVAISAQILFQNIERMLEEHQLLTASLQDVLTTPSLAGRYYDMTFMPDKGHEPIEVTVQGTYSKEQMIERANRNLAYKILLRRGTHGVNYSIQRQNDSVTVRAIPIGLTRSL